MANRYLDWLRQAESDLRHALHACEDGDFDWSCFAAHQASEKALKGVLQKLGKEAWGHTLTLLLGNLTPALSVPEELLNRARMLDKHYIPTRYPNGFESGAPVDFYTKEEAETAIRNSEAILEFCRRTVG